MSLFDKIKNALKKTSSTISLAITGKKVDAEFLENLRDALILADVGVQTSDKLIEALSKQKFAKEMTEEEVKNILASNIESMLLPYEKTLFTQLHSPEIVLMVGVNGNGKTTTVAKLANLLKNPVINRCWSPVIRLELLQFHSWSTGHKKSAWKFVKERIKVMLQGWYTAL